jgi:hypothetical protein
VSWAAAGCWSSSARSSGGSPAWPSGSPTTLDCVDAGFVTDQTLDELPRPCRLGRTKVGGVDLNQPRTRAAPAAVLALAAAPRGFTVAELTAKVQQMTGQTSYTIR